MKKELNTDEILMAIKPDTIRCIQCKCYFRGSKTFALMKRIMPTYSLPSWEKLTLCILCGWSPRYFYAGIYPTFDFLNINTMEDTYDNLYEITDTGREFTILKKKETNGS